MYRVAEVEFCQVKAKRHFIAVNRRQKIKINNLQLAGFTLHGANVTTQ